MEKKIRTFIALDLSREAINEIQRIQRIIKNKKMFMGKFTEPENLHLTLKFLGEIDDNKIKEVKKRLKEIKFESFDMELKEVGKFFSRKRDVIWIRVGGKKVHELQKQIDKLLRDLFKSEHRFMGHITIARVKNVFNRKGFLDYIKNMKIKKIRFKVDKFFLKRSELFAGGPVYSDIEKYNLES